MLLIAPPPAVAPMLLPTQALNFAATVPSFQTQITSTNAVAEDSSPPMIFAVLEQLLLVELLPESNAAVQLPSTPPPKAAVMVEFKAPPTETNAAELEPSTLPPKLAVEAKLPPELA